MTAAQPCVCQAIRFHCTESAQVPAAVLDQNQSQEQAGVAYSGDAGAVPFTAKCTPPRQRLLRRTHTAVVAIPVSDHRGPGYCSRHSV